MLQVPAFKCCKCARLSEDEKEIEQCELNHAFEKSIRERLMERLNKCWQRKVSWRYEGHHPMSLVLTEVSKVSLGKVWFVGAVCHAQVNFELANQQCSFKFEGTTDELDKVFDNFEKGEPICGLNSERVRAVNV